MCVSIADSLDVWIAKQIRYPGNWDTAAYPSLACALWEMVDVRSLQSVCVVVGREE